MMRCSNMSQQMVYYSRACCVSGATYSTALAKKLDAVHSTSTSSTSPAPTAYRCACAMAAKKARRSFRPMIGLAATTMASGTAAPADDAHASLGLCVGSGEETRARSVFSMPADADDGWVWCRARDPEGMHRMFAHIVHYVRDVELGAVEPIVVGDDRTRVLSDPLEECPTRETNPEYYERVRPHACSPRLHAPPRYRPSRTGSSTASMHSRLCLSRICFSSFPTRGRGTESAHQGTKKW